MLHGRVIHLCVAGGIAAYKAVELARAFQKAGAEVRVAMTPNAREFVGPLTFQAITRHPVLTRTLDPSEEMQIGHIAFAQECDALVVAPATANVIGKAANGLGDEIVSTVLLAADVPVLFAPAMNTHMWENPAVQENLRRLRARGWGVVQPDAGQLACGHVGPGRLPDAATIVDALAALLGSKPGALSGRRLVISAGPTREHFDPVRFLGNPSSGKTGFALAEVAARAGAQVTLVHGPVSLPPPENVEAVAVTSALEMHRAVMAAAAQADAVVMTAAVADWRPAEVSETKRKKAGESWTVQMVRNPDILAELGAERVGAARPLLVGFAAETGHPVENARSKLAAKRVDLVVANDVSSGVGFASDDNRVWFVEAEAVEGLPLMRKHDIAEALVHWLAVRFEAEAAR